jgi:hypothetical protein
MDERDYIAMQKYLNENDMKEDKLSEISYKVFYGMKNYSQLIIDLVQEVEELHQTYKVNHESFGAKNYDINLILEIIDPLRTHDIEVLNELSEILEETFKSE